METESKLAIYSKFMAGLGTSLLAFHFLWGALVIAVPICMNEWFLRGSYFALLLIAIVLVVRKKILQNRWFPWLCFFLFLNLAIGKTVSNKIMKCSTPQLKVEVK